MTYSPFDAPQNLLAGKPLTNLGGTNFSATSPTQVVSSSAGAVDRQTAVKGDATKLLSTLNNPVNPIGGSSQQPGANSGIDTSGTQATNPHYGLLGTAPQTLGGAPGSPAGGSGGAGGASGDVGTGGGAGAPIVQPPTPQPTSSTGGTTYWQIPGGAMVTIQQGDTPPAGASQTDVSGQPITPASPQSPAQPSTGGVDAAAKAAQDAANGIFTQDQQNQIGQAGTAAGSAYDSAIIDAQKSKYYGMPEAVQAGLRAGGALNTQISGSSAAPGQEGQAQGSFIGRGGELEKISSAYDFNIQQLEAQKNSAIQQAKMAAQQAVVSGKKEDYGYAVDAYNRALAVSQQQQQATADRTKALTDLANLTKPYQVGESTYQNQRQADGSYKPVELPSAAKPISLAPGAKLVNPITGEEIASGMPKTVSMGKYGTMEWNDTTQSWDPVKTTASSGGTSNKSTSSANPTMISIPTKKDSSGNPIKDIPAFIAKLDPLVKQIIPVNKGGLGITDYDKLSAKDKDRLAGQISQAAELGLIPQDIALRTADRLEKAATLREASSVLSGTGFRTDPRISGYRAAVSNYPTIENAYDIIKTQSPGLEISSAPQDLDLVDGYIAMSRGGTVTEAQASLLTQAQSWSDQIKNLIQQKKTGGFLTPTSRLQIKKAADEMLKLKYNISTKATVEYQKRLDSNQIDYKLTPDNAPELLSANSNNFTSQQLTTMKSQLQPGEVLGYDSNGNPVGLTQEEAQSGQYELVQ